MTTSRPNNDGEREDGLAAPARSGRHFRASEAPIDAAGMGEELPSAPASAPEAAAGDDDLPAPSAPGRRFKPKPAVSDADEDEPAAVGTRFAAPSTAAADGVPAAHAAPVVDAVSAVDGVPAADAELAADAAPATDAAPEAEEPVADHESDDVDEPVESVRFDAAEPDKPARRKMPLPLRVVLVLVAVLAVAGGGTALALKLMIDRGGEALHEASNPEDIQTSENADTQDDGLTVEYDGTTYRYNENIVSIVVMGYDRREDVSVTGAAGQADAVMVVAFDMRTGEMRIIGIPRDTMVDVDENVGDSFMGQDKMQLALSFSYGDGYESSSENVVRAVSRILYNMPMNYYVALDMQGVGPINDAVGGVSLTPIETIPDTSIVKDVPTTLYGYEAMRYVQYRDITQLESSLDRQARQSQYLKAFFSQAIATAAGDPAALVGLYRTALDYGFTNMGISEFAFLAAILVEHGMDDLDVTTLKGTAEKGSQYVEYTLDQDSVYETVLDVYYTPVEDEE